MAQKVQTLFVDDLNGSTAEGTVRFGRDGTEYEIDLSAGHAQQLRNALAVTGLNTTEVREWAKAQGIEVKDRGRVPAELVVRFKAATAQ